MNTSDIATRYSHPLLLSNSDLLFFGIEFSYSPNPEWPNLQVGDNFTFPSTPTHNLVNDVCFSNVTACILCANFNNFNEASSGLFETGKNVADINNLVNPSARLTSTSYAYDNSVDASTCLTSASTKVIFLRTPQAETINFHPLRYFWVRKIVIFIVFCLLNFASFVRFCLWHARKKCFLKKF